MRNKSGNRKEVVGLLNFLQKFREIDVTFSNVTFCVKLIPETKFKFAIFS